MDGMQYLKRSFTVPAGSSQITAEKWDLAFLSPEEYRAKYGISDKAYDKLVKE